MAEPIGQGDGDIEDPDGDGDGPAPPRRQRTPGVSSAKTAIERLDPRERRYSFIAAGGALLFGVAVYFLEKDGHVHFSKNPDAPLTTFILGAACGALLLGATWFGRRALVGFVALFTFLVFGTTSLFLGVPFLALAVWLLHRSYKIQKEAAAAAREARGATPSSPRARSSDGPARSSRSGSPKATRAGTRDRTPARPEANKRYTPKRPPPPAPKPSRRERKAAQAPE
jgi:hypothetical protein